MRAITAEAKAAGQDAEPNAESRHLIEGAQRGTAGALEEAYRRYAQDIFAELRAQTGSSVLAEELTAEVFCRLAASPAVRQARGRRLRAWLHVVARNLAIDAQRRGRRQRCLPLQALVTARETSDSGYPPAQAERRLEMERLAAAVQELTNPQRQVIWLRFVEGYSSAETAALLGKEENSVKALQHRALGSLRRQLEREGVL